MHTLRIAIAGAGTTGLAAAAFLERAGHDVRIFERFEAPRPLGAGVLLQPTGLAFLARLGLDHEAIALGARIDGIEGKHPHEIAVAVAAELLLRRDAMRRAAASAGAGEEALGPA